MSELNDQEQVAIEAVARHFSGTWENGEGPPDAYVDIAGKRIAVEITAIRQWRADQGRLTEPRLRFDRVALGLVRRLQAALPESVSDGQTVVITITAPIRMPSKTAAALENKIQGYLAPRPAQLEAADTIHGNRVRVHLVTGVPKRAPKVVGFVHNPDSDPDVLLDVTQTLLERLGAESGKRASEGFDGDRWLVLANGGGLAHTETYRQVCSQLAIATEFKKILMVLAGGRVEILVG